MQLHSKRKLVNKIALSLSLGAMLFGLFWLAWILFTVLESGILAFSVDLFTQMTPTVGVQGGGLANAIAGSGLLVAAGALIGSPLGILVGIYLAEYGQSTLLGKLTRYVNDLLLSAPSIVIGLFVYAVVVAKTGQFSGWAGALALALIVIPVVVRTTESMLLLVPNSLREAAYALGAPKRTVILWVTLRAAKAGVVTGILLSVARIAGETAPLLFTALSNQFWSLDMSHPIANLPKVIYEFAMNGDPNLQRLAWAGVLLITLGVLALNIVARVFFRQQHSN
ncbi:phosphate ABC transporter permease PstA [Uliginosibacterium gangwonense]|uniref:phosphate ABC transporter permease PstA n=1 Tax=Uliginosibacterium gangwonense TaxID=392736 RepID=UPI00035EBCAA|nr:phosphate ABC transporter permease PstA [Uliginosibacterium gangwonense]